jgi:hypothetical protein
VNANQPMTEDDRLAVMTHVDGEMAAADQAAFDARLAHEPALAAAVARERALRTRLQLAYAPVLEEPVPAGLLDLLALPEPAPAAANDNVPAGANDAWRAGLPRAGRWRWRWPEWGAIAAALMLGVVFGSRMLTLHPGAETLALNVGDDGSITAQGGLRDALEQRAAGADAKPDTGVSVGLSFRNHAQQYCRTFTLDNASSGIACKGGDGWVVANLEHAAGVPASGAGAYRTAASLFSPTLLAAVDALREGDTLDAAAEAAAKAKGWKP